MMMSSNVNTFRILEAPRFGFRLFQPLCNFDSAAADVPVQFQSDTISVTPNLAAPSLHEIWL